MHVVVWHWTNCGGILENGAAENDDDVARDTTKQNQSRSKSRKTYSCLVRGNALQLSSDSENICEHVRASLRPNDCAPFEQGCKITQRFELGLA